MSTFLFDKIIFGPVHSRRLGLSLGVNLLSPSSKHCNFDCIYCECGWNASSPKGSFNSLTAVESRLRSKLVEMKIEGQLPSYITFAGNGEPTMHPDFENVIHATLKLRDELAPLAKIAVLSNATMIDRQGVRDALLLVDRNILKLDSAIDSTVKTINQPNRLRSVADTIALMKLFEGRLVVQTMMIRGQYNGVSYDNTSPEELAALEAALVEINPSEVMLYSIDRDTPADGIMKIKQAELESIAAQLRLAGLNVMVS